MKVRAVIKLIKEDGWYFHRSGKGDHKIYKHPTKPGIVPIDGKPSEDMPKGTSTRFSSSRG
jgi:predicted RNA binding protein YcfA (HicA-like mRNA interferase family)